MIYNLEKPRYPKYAQPESMTKFIKNTCRMYDGKDEKGEAKYKNIRVNSAPVVKEFSHN
jgi:hypothetical protein